MFRNSFKGLGCLVFAFVAVMCIIVVVVLTIFLFNIDYAGIANDFKNWIQDLTNALNSTNNSISNTVPSSTALIS